MVDLTRRNNPGRLSYDLFNFTHCCFIIRQAIAKTFELVILFFLDIYFITVKYHFICVFRSDGSWIFHWWFRNSRYGIIFIYPFHKILRNSSFLFSSPFSYDLALLHTTIFRNCKIFSIIRITATNQEMKLLSSWKSKPKYIKHNILQRCLPKLSQLK